MLIANGSNAKHHQNPFNRYSLIPSSKPWSLNILLPEWLCRVVTIQNTSTIVLNNHFVTFNHVEQCYGNTFTRRDWSILRKNANEEIRANYVFTCSRASALTNVTWGSPIRIHLTWWLKLHSRDHANGYARESVWYLRACHHLLNLHRMSKIESQ